MRTQFEHEFWDKNLEYVIGIDEAGRGPIAGPLVVAAVCFPKGYEMDSINDSKQLSEKKRAILYDQIIEDALEYHIEIVDEETVDKENIYRATQNAMTRLAKSFTTCDAVLSDAMPLPDLDCPVNALVKGDALSVTIGAASILAKVTRDTIMIAYDKEYPEYGFAKHKGYPTKMHLEALEKYGVLSIHRRSYGPVQRELQKQLTLEL